VLINSGCVVSIDIHFQERILSLPGVWSPGQTPLAKQPSPERAATGPQKNEPIPAVWTPASAGASPVAEKKEFRSVPFESPVLSRKKQPREEVCLINLRPDSYLLSTKNWIRN